MGQIINSPSMGGGVLDLSFITADANKILSGYIGSDIEGNPVEGSMVDNGATTESLNAGDIYTIPAGYHNGSGKITVNSLASQTHASALVSDITAGKTAWVNGEMITGNVANHGAVTASLNAGQSYTIPLGFHNGNGKVTANGLAEQTSATAIAGDILSGKNAWVNGVKVNGSMINRGAYTSALPINGRINIPAGYHNGSGYINQSIPTQGAMTLNPGTSQKVGSVSGKYMTGNITVPAVNISPSIIKKNHKLTLPDGSSVTGTFEGYAKNSPMVLLDGRNFFHVTSQSGSSVYYAESWVDVSGTTTFYWDNLIDPYRYNYIVIHGGNLSNPSHYVRVKFTYNQLYDIVLDTSGGYPSYGKNMPISIELGTYNLPSYSSNGNKYLSYWITVDLSPLAPLKNNAKYNMQITFKNMNLNIIQLR